MVDECCDPNLQGPGSSNAPALREAAATVVEGQLKGFSQGILEKQLPTSNVNSSLPTNLNFCQEGVIVLSFVTI